MSSCPVRLNPGTLPDSSTVGYSQISIADGNRLAFVSGQVAWKAEEKTVPETIAEQTSVVIDHLQSALGALHASPRDIVQMRLYLTNASAETQEIAMPMILTFLDGAQPSLTGIGVAALAMPELLIEVEMVVQVPEGSST